MSSRNPRNGSTLIGGSNHEGTFDHRYAQGFHIEARIIYFRNFSIYRYKILSLDVIIRAAFAQVMMGGPK